MMDISTIRKEYKQKELSEEAVESNPVKQFENWFQEALSSKINEPTAMVLGTCGMNNVVTQRTVLLKAFDKKGFVFYTNYKSRKAKQIQENSNVSLLFPWYELERQVAIIGQVQKITTAESAKYFLSRPKGSQMGAWISNQSEVITSRSILEQKFAEIKRKFGEGEIPLPDFWGGFRVIPSSVEFWQGRPSRLHDRILYSGSDDNWRIERLSP